MFPVDNRAAVSGFEVEIDGVSNASLLSQNPLIDSPNRNPFTRDESNVNKTNFSVPCSHLEHNDVSYLLPAQLTP